MRSEIGSFGKVTRIEENKFLYENKTLITWVGKVKKHSFNVIDLIEKNDYVNGYKVLQKIKSNIDGGTIRILLFKNNYSETWQTFSENQIKEIVTHEQFNSIKYEVRDENSL